MLNTIIIFIKILGGRVIPDFGAIASHTTEFMHCALMSLAYIHYQVSMSYVDLLSTSMDGKVLTERLLFSMLKIIATVFFFFRPLFGSPKKYSLQSSINSVLLQISTHIKTHTMQTHTHTHRHRHTH